MLGSFWIKCTGRECLHPPQSKAARESLKTACKLFSREDRTSACADFDTSHTRCGLNGNPAGLSRRDRPAGCNVVTWSEAAAFSILSGSPSIRHDLRSRLRAINASSSSAVGSGAEVCAPLAKLFEATGGAAPLVYSNLVAVLALSFLLGNHDKRRKDAIKAFTVNEGFEEVFGTMSFTHICKTMRTCKAVHRPTKSPRA
jgi:hypothetical protein